MDLKTLSKIRAIIQNNNRKIHLGNGITYQDVVNSIIIDIDKLIEKQVRKNKIK